MQDRYIKRLVARSKCTVCGQRYRADNVSVLGHEDEFWFLSVFCDRCQNERLVAALIKSPRTEESASIAVSREASRSVEHPAIGYDDVLDMHSFLQGFDGNFHRLFGSEPLS